MKTQMPTASTALPGRDRPVPTPPAHFVSGNAMDVPFPPGLELALFGMGCFWGAERLFWKLPGVWSTQVGYAGGFTHNPSYQEVCTGQTGHAEVVRVVFDPREISYQRLLATFWENHDPTQGMRQGNDLGTQYRSCILTCSDRQLTEANASAERFATALTRVRQGAVTTEIKPAGTFYFAEEYHQQYLAKNPGGYCGIAGIGVCLPPAASGA